MLGKRNLQNPFESSSKQPRWSKEIADADCVLPEELMLCILARLPVKSLLRFKSVCKPWRSLFSSPDFIKMHRYHFSNSPKNEAFIINSISKKNYVHPMSLFTIESDEKGPTNLDLPYHKMDILGCCNGLFCLGGRRHGQDIVLWNPATRLSKFVTPPGVNFGISLGFGYDSEKDDFKVVRIVHFEKEKKRNGRFGAHVYSAKSDSWKKIKLGFQFRILSAKTVAIVDGNPYWVASLDENENQFCDVFLWFDVKEMAFKTVPKWSLQIKEGAMKVVWVDWRGCLAAIACFGNEERIESVDVWVFDGEKLVWELNHTFGPVDMKMERCLQCSKNGKVVGACQDGRLFVFDPENGRVEEFQIGEITSACLRSFEIYGYNESFAFIEGMKPVY